MFFLIPAMCLSHLFSAPLGLQEAFVAANVVLLSVFAGRKWTQEVKDDVGDKSVFLFQAMDEQQQAALIKELGLTEDML